MSGRIYLWGIGLATAFTLIAFTLVLLNFDPGLSGRIGVGLFFVSLIATIWGISILILMFIYNRQRKLPTPSFVVVLRQASLITFLIAGFLILESLKVLAWWNGALVILAALVMEMYARIKVE